MSLQDVVDFANRANQEMGRYRLEFFLVPAQLSRSNYTLPSLAWSFIDYGSAGLKKVPDDKRGIYAFVAVVHPNTTLPPHGYVLYIGIAGRKSSRSLRARYADYLNDKKVNKRPHIANMIGNWHPVLKFYYAPIDSTVKSEDLEEMERELNSCLFPPFSRGDLEADAKKLRSAFT